MGIGTGKQQKRSIRKHILTENKIRVFKRKDQEILYQTQRINQIKNNTIILQDSLLCPVRSWFDHSTANPLSYSASAAIFRTTVSPNLGKEGGRADVLMSTVHWRLSVSLSANSRDISLKANNLADLREVPTQLFALFHPAPQTLKLRQSHVNFKHLNITTSNCLPC